MLIWLVRPLLSQVKPRHDPTMRLYLDEYSTYLRIHAWGVSVEVQEGESRHRVFLWPYTDLYKWSILSQNCKLALQLTVFTSGQFADQLPSEGSRRW